MYFELNFDSAEKIYTSIRSILDTFYGNFFCVGFRYDEIANYNFETGTSNGGEIGHFTQLVWDSSTKLGCGVAKSASSGGQFKNYIVARYLVAGNTVGQYTQHVHAEKPENDQQDPQLVQRDVL